MLSARHLDHPICWAFVRSYSPSALYLASNLDPSTPSDKGGYLDLDYGVGGNVVSMTVHAQCVDRAPNVCVDPGGNDPVLRRDTIRSRCTCASEQHYSYRYDELNRMSEARRFDRESGLWSLKARQRYRYDSANQRTVKETSDVASNDTRATLYVLPGDFERRGLRVTTNAFTAIGAETETQYMVAGARVVWQDRDALTPGQLDPDHRITFAVGDLIQSTSAVVDLMSGELLEVTGFYPNGAREHWLDSSLGNADAIPLETVGFTGKEADEEVGLTYFGERYLIQRIGRWATPDPLAIHAMGGGEAGNSYHYVSGNLLQSRDPLGLEPLAGGGLKAGANAFGLSLSLGAGYWRESGTDKSGFYIAGSLGGSVGASIEADGQIVMNNGGVDSFRGLSTTKALAAGYGVAGEVAYSQPANDFGEALQNAFSDLTLDAYPDANEDAQGTGSVAAGAGVGAAASYTVDSTLAVQLTGRDGLIGNVKEILRYYFTDDRAAPQSATSSAQRSMLDPPGAQPASEAYGEGAPLRPEFEHLREGASKSAAGRSAAASDARSSHTSSGSAATSTQPDPTSTQADPSPSAPAWSSEDAAQCVEPGEGT